MEGISWGCVVEQKHELGQPIQPEIVSSTIALFPIWAETEKARDAHTSNFPTELRRYLYSEVQW